MTFALQIIQHYGPLPIEEAGAAAKQVVSRKPDRQASELSAMRPKNSKHTQRPQHLGPDNVEGILTLQLSHPNVVQTFKAVTRPLQVLSRIPARKGKGRGRKGKGAESAEGVERDGGGGGGGERSFTCLTCAL